MSKVLVTDTYLSDIADAIRAKNGTKTAYKPNEMSSAIEAISVDFTLDFDAETGLLTMTTDSGIVSASVNEEGYLEVTA